MILFVLLTFYDMVNVGLDLPLRVTEEVAFERAYRTGELARRILVLLE